MKQIYQGLDALHGTACLDKDKGNHDCGYCVE